MAMQDMLQQVNYEKARKKGNGSLYALQSLVDGCGKATTAMEVLLLVDEHRIYYIRQPIEMVLLTPHQTFSLSDGCWRRC
jgi:hypothetical protein